MMIKFKRNKYFNKKKECDGYKFDSEKECKRYIYLKFLQKAGKIKELQVHPVFVLLQSFNLNKKKFAPLKYIADFSYKDNNDNLVVEDVKGLKTQVYQIKKKLMAYFLKIEITEI